MHHAHGQQVGRQQWLTWTAGVVPQLVDLAPPQTASTAADVDGSEHNDGNHLIRT